MRSTTFFLLLLLLLACLFASHRLVRSERPAGCLVGGSDADAVNQAKVCTNAVNQAKADQAAADVERMARTLQTNNSRNPALNPAVLDLEQQTLWTLALRIRLSSTDQARADWLQKAVDAYARAILPSTTVGMSTANAVVMDAMLTGHVYPMKCKFTPNLTYNPSDHSGDRMLGYAQYTRIDPILSKTMSHRGNGHVPHYGTSGQWIQAPDGSEGKPWASIEGGMFFCEKYGLQRLPRYHVAISSHRYDMRSDTLGGWGFFERALPPQYWSRVILSQTLLLPPCGVCFDEGQTGGLFGGGWVAMPLFAFDDPYPTHPKTTGYYDPNHSSAPKVGDLTPKTPLTWTFFADASNYSGVVCGYPPQFFARRLDRWASLREREDESTKKLNYLYPNIERTLAFHGKHPKDDASTDESDYVSIGGELPNLPCAFAVAVGPIDPTDRNRTPLVWKIPEITLPATNAPWVANAQFFTEKNYDWLSSLRPWFRTVKSGAVSSVAPSVRASAVGGSVMGRAALAIDHSRIDAVRRAWCGGSSKTPLPVVASPTILPIVAPSASSTPSAPSTTTSVYLKGWGARFDRDVVPAKFGVKLVFENRNEIDQNLALADHSVDAKDPARPTTMVAKNNRTTAPTNVLDRYYTTEPAATTCKPTPDAQRPVSLREKEHDTQKTKPIRFENKYLRAYVLLHAKDRKLNKITLSDGTTVEYGYVPFHAQPALASLKAEFPTDFAWATGDIALAEQHAVRLANATVLPADIPPVTVPMNDSIRAQLKSLQSIALPRQSTAVNEFEASELAAMDRAMVVEGFDGYVPIAVGSAPPTSDVEPCDQSVIAAYEKDRANRNTPNYTHSTSTLPPRASSTPPRASSTPPRASSTPPRASSVPTPPLCW